MKASRFLFALLAAVTLIAGASSCSQNFIRDEPVGLTRDAAFLSGCQKLEEVKVSTRVPAEEVQMSIGDAVRRKGGNYALVETLTSRSAIAYKCTATTATAKAGS